MGLYLKTIDLSKKISNLSDENKKKVQEYIQNVTENNIQYPGVGYNRHNLIKVYSKNRNKLK